MHKHEAQRYTRLSQLTAQSSNLQTAHARVGGGAALEQASKMTCAIASYPSSCGGGEKRAWYRPFVNTLNMFGGRHKGKY